MTSIHYRSLRRDYFERLDETRAGRNIAGNQTAKDVRDGRHSDRFDRIQRAGHLRRTPGEIDLRAIAFDGDMNANRDFAAADAVIIKRVTGFITAIRDLFDGMPHYAG